MPKTPQTTAGPTGTTSAWTPPAEGPAAVRCAARGAEPQADGMRRELTVEGGRDPDEVWDRYVRPARWPEWSPQISSVEYAFERLRGGTSGVVRAIGGVGVPFTVTGVDEGDPSQRSWTWQARVLGAVLA